MKINLFIIFVIIISLASEIFSQTQQPAAVVKSFYLLHFSKENVFTPKALSLRQRFFTPRLRRLFNNELIREKVYLKKYPTNKPFFDVLPFQPIELCKNDYSIGKTQIIKQTTVVTVNFVYSKSSCTANDGTNISYKIKLAKVAGSWLIDDVIYDDRTTLTDAFRIAKKIR